MQAIIETIEMHEMEQVTAEKAAVTYLNQTFPYPCQLGKGCQMSNGDWRFLVLYISSDLKRPQTIAVLHIDGGSGKVIPLTDDEKQDANERTVIAKAEGQDRLPLQNGYVPRLFARHQANRYLSESVGFLFTPVDAIFIPIDGPVWQFSIQLRLPRLGNLSVLGTLDVDAKSGEVLPLTTQQITQIQSRANAIARYQTQPAAA